MITRDQRRAQHAYHCLAQVPMEQREDYKVLVNGLGANILRSGLAAAIAFLEREKRKEAGLLLGHLATAGIPNLAETDEKTFPDAVRSLDLENYMLVTREMLRVVLWFRRAVQADVPVVKPTPERRK